ncbi:sulfatase-like hydrolase/transferase, partial [Candidatus Hydrogenedentota bacterium]
MPIPSLAGLKTSNERFNVVLIVLDTLRVKNVSCYGYGKETTPNLDKIAAEGVLFENCFTPACWTLPSHVSMFTGLYPFTHRADMEHPYFENIFPTWAELGTQLGYRTAAFNPNNWIQVAQAERGFWLYDSCKQPTHYKNGRQFTVDRFNQWLDAYRGDESPFFTFLNFGDPHLTCWPSDKNRARFLPEGVTEVEESEKRTFI